MGVETCLTPTHNDGFVGGSSLVKVLNAWGGFQGYSSG